MNFEAEFLALLKKHGVAFDPQFALGWTEPVSRLRRSGLPLRFFPGLPAWASLCRAYGAGLSGKRDGERPQRYYRRDLGATAGCALALERRWWTRKCRAWLRGL